MKPYNWLNEFLNKRNLKNVTGRNLYEYQLKIDEYYSLEEILKTNVSGNKGDFDFKYWAACFTLYVSEWYRRDYDSNWSWDKVEKNIGKKFTATEHKYLVEIGLVEYWKRPIRKRNETSNDYLGSLFLEGGLPWSFMSEGHSLGRIISLGVREYYRIQTSRTTLSDIIKDHEYYLPKTFQTEEVKLILLRIIEELMLLIETVPQEGKTNPYSYLDNTNPRWRFKFPIPLDVENGQALVNKWLIDASLSDRSKKNRTQKISCKHFHIGSLTTLRITSILNYPKTISIPKPDFDLPTSRLEMLLYEGNRLIKHEGTVYSRIEEQQVIITILKNSSKVIRNQPSQALNIRFTVNGINLNKLTIASSSINSDSIITFEKVEDTYQYISDGSCNVESSKAVVYLPRQTDCINNNVKRVGLGPNGIRWVEIVESERFKNGDDIFQVALNAEYNDDFQFVGKELKMDTLPSQCYLGLPQFSNIGNLECEYHIFINEKEIDNFTPTNLAGKLRYTVKDRNGITILRKTIGILPENFQIANYSSSIDNEAYIELKGLTDLCEIFIDEKEVSVDIKELNTTKRLYFNTEDSLEKPEFLTIIILNRIIRKPVKIKVPYPSYGVSLFNAQEEIITTDYLSIDELLGMRLKLSSGGKKQRFFIELALKTRSNNCTAHIDHVYEVEFEPIIINLFSLRSEIMMLLSVNSDQDDQVVLKILEQSAKLLLQLNIVRYYGIVKVEGQKVWVENFSNGNVIYNSQPCLMDVSRPSSKYQELEQVKTENVDTGYYYLDQFRGNSEIYLIIPHEDADKSFRPFFLQPENSFSSFISTKSLAEAVRQFHPFHNPNAFQHALSVLISDLDNPGWDYLQDLLDNFSHLPFSTFRVWIALCQNTNALALAILKLNTFSEQALRFSEELAFFWEIIPINNWINAFAQLKEWYLNNNIPVEIIHKILEPKIDKLEPILPMLKKHLKDYLLYNELKKLPMQIYSHAINEWFQCLMINHAATMEKWPTELNEELCQWFGSIDTLPIERSFIKSNYQNSVGLLPLFMAQVTIGNAKLEDLGIQSLPDLKFKIRKIINFDKEWYNPVYRMMVYLLEQINID